MASRDLTSTFIERRSVTNRRRRASGGTTSSSNVAPFGKYCKVVSILQIIILVHLSCLFGGVISLSLIKSLWKGISYTLSFCTMDID